MFVYSYVHIDVLLQFNSTSLDTVEAFIERNDIFGHDLLFTINDSEVKSRCLLLYIVDATSA